MFIIFFPFLFWPDMYKMIHEHKALNNVEMISGTLWSDCSVLAISEN